MLQHFKIRRVYMKHIPQYNHTKRMLTANAGGQQEEKKSQARGRGVQNSHTGIPLNHDYTASRGHWFKTHVLHPQKTNRDSHDIILHHSLTIRLGTWNTTGLLQAGQMHSIVRVMKTQHIDVMVLTETHMKEPDQYLIQGYTFTHSADAERDPNTGRLKQNFAGIAVVTAPKITPTLTVIRTHSARLFTATLKPH